MNKENYDFKECMFTGCHKIINSDLCKSYYDSGCKLIDILEKCEFKKHLLTKETLKDSVK